jgi:hypothetical protein
MPDDLDPQLLRAFAQADRPLPEEPFVAGVAARVQPAGGLRLGAAGLYSLLGTVLGTVASGILLPLRMRQTRLMTLGAAAVTLWVAFF